MFTSLVLSTTDGMGREATTLYTGMSCRHDSTEKTTPYPVVMGWLRCQLSFDSLKLLLSDSAFSMFVLYCLHAFYRIFLHTFYLISPHYGNVKLPFSKFIVEGSKDFGIKNFGMRTNQFTFQSPYFSIVFCWINNNNKSIKLDMQLTGLPQFVESRNTTLLAFFKV